MKKETKLTFRMGISFLVLAVGALFVGQTVLAGESQTHDSSAWKTDIAEAKAEAKAEGKTILMDFRGSDWCPPCIQLHKQVLSKEAFKAYAAKELVLVDLDFPRKKSLPADQKAHNEKLAREYGVQYFPTVIIADADGKELDRIVGFPKGGYDGFMDFLAKNVK